MYSKRTGFTKRKKNGGGNKYSHQYDLDVMSVNTPYAPQGRSDYALTLLNPWKKMQTRIPDLSSFPTATFSIESKFPWTVQSGATLATNNQILLITLASQPVIEYFGGSGAGANQGVVSTVTAPAVVDTSITTRYKTARLVSAGVRIRFAGNDTNTVGQIYAMAVPADRNQSGVAHTAGSTLDLSADTVISAQPGIQISPLVEGVELRYQPQEANNFNFWSVNNSAFAYNAVFAFGSFMIYATQFSNAAQPQFTVELTANYEALPIANNIGLEAMKGPNDPVAQAHGMEVVGRAANVFTATPASEAINIVAPIRSLMSGKRKR